MQAYAGGLADKQIENAAAKLAENTDGTVPVVCTPSGGAQTVRLELDKNWLEDLSDEDLLVAIAAARSEA